MAVRIELLDKVVIAKRCFKNNCMKQAGKAWVELYDIIEELENTEGKEKVMHEYHQTMALFTDDEVYGITDYLKKKAGC